MDFEGQQSLKKASEYKILAGDNFQSFPSLVCVGNKPVFRTKSKFHKNDQIYLFI